MVCATEGMGSTGKDHSTNARFWHMPKTPRLTLPQTPFKTQEVVEYFWKGQNSDHRLRPRLYRRPAP